MGLRGRVVVFYVAKVSIIDENKNLIDVIEGRQHLGAFFNIVAYYVLALPMGITLAFHPKTHLGLEGLWIGE